MPGCSQPGQPERDAEPISAGPSAAPASRIFCQSTQTGREPILLPDIGRSRSPLVPTDHCHNTPSANTRLTRRWLSHRAGRASAGEKRGRPAAVALQESRGRLLDAVRRRCPAPGQTALGGASSGRAGRQAGRQRRDYASLSKERTIDSPGSRSRSPGRVILLDRTDEFPLWAAAPASQTTPASDDFRPGIRCHVPARPGVRPRSPGITQRLANAMGGVRHVCAAG
jgi:hypothetical protein